MNFLSNLTVLKSSLYEIFIVGSSFGTIVVPSMPGRQTTMKTKIAIVTLSVAFALTATNALAGGKKEEADPRVAYRAAKAEHPNGRQSWCDIDPNCNGSAKALEMAKQGKLKF
jgi:hypothetical protein